MVEQEVMIERVDNTHFEINGYRYCVKPFSVGLTPQGALTGVAAINMAINRGKEQLRVLDICAGVGIVGLVMYSLSPKKIVSEVAFADINIFNLRSIQATLADNALPTFNTWLSDCLSHVPPEEKFDVIVSNPPHYLEDANCEQDWDHAAMQLGTYDPKWKFHSDFYERCHEHLAPEGEVWFLENSKGASVESFLPMIESNEHLTYIGSYAEPLDKSFFWMISRLSGK